MQTEMSFLKHYSKHLKADGVIGTREYQLKKLMDILGLIAKIKDRRLNITETSQSFYGLSEDGHIRTTPKELEKYLMYGRMLDRVKLYYNKHLLTLKSF